MSLTAYEWSRALHFYGFLLWVGSMFGVAFALHYSRQQTEEAGKRALAGYAKKGAMAMDIGAFLAMLAGIYMLIRLNPSPIKQAWMHIKLVGVVALVGLHGYLRVQVRKHTDGRAAGLPSFVVPVLYALAVGIIVLAAVKPFQ